MHLTLFGEIKKRQVEVQATDDEMRNAVGWTRKVWRARNADPSRITLGEFSELCNYLGLHFERREK